MPSFRHTDYVDLWVTVLAQRPRALLAAGAGLGLSLAFAVTLPGLSFVLPRRGPVAAPAPASPAAERSDDLPRSDGELDPLAIVGAYNAASIAAAAAGDAELVMPFFATGSREPQAIRAEFARRAQRGERHRSSLVRWGVAEQRVRGSSASIVTQEVWDDEVFSHGRRVDARRGTVVRIRYSLRRAGVASPWRIQSIDSTTVVP